MIYAFEEFSINTTNTPQPSIYTTLTAAYPGGSIPGGAVQLSVSSSAVFYPGDRLWVDQGASAELAKIDSIPSATSLIVETVVTPSSSAQGLFKSHSSGAFITLSMRFAAVAIQNVLGGNAATIYVYCWPNAFQALASYGRGSLQPSTSAPYPLLIGAIPSGGGSVSVGNIYGANPEVTDVIWVAGTAGDTYFVELTQL